jgi:hypothetical protein
MVSDPQDETTRLQAIRHYRRFCEMVAKERAAGIVIETTDEWWGEIAETLLAVEQSASVLAATMREQVALSLFRAEQAAKASAEAQLINRNSQLQETRTMTPQLQEWNNAINCATEFPPEESLTGRWMRRVQSAGMALASDYEKAVERANREANLAVALRLKLEEVAGPEIASSVNV